MTSGVPYARDGCVETELAKLAGSMHPAGIWRQRPLSARPGAPQPYFGGITESSVNVRSVAGTRWPWPSWSTITNERR